MKPLKVNIPDYLRRKMDKQKEEKEIDLAVQIRTALHNYFKKMEAKE